MRHHLKPRHELSWFLISYLMMLLSVLLGIHLLQPAWERPRGSSLSPLHQQQPAKQALAR